MSQIQTIEAIVVDKLNYSDTSKIVQLFGKTTGKISAIIKGGRGSNAKVGRVIDSFNHVNAIIYFKENRDLQTISDAELLTYHAGIREDFTTLAYAGAALELIKTVVPDHQPNTRLFNGLKRILDRFNSADEAPEILFARFFLFFLEEEGYGINTHHCNACGTEFTDEGQKGFLYDTGLICNNCIKQGKDVKWISKELFIIFKGLKEGKTVESSRTSEVKIVLRLLDKYVRMHIPGFQGLRSLQLV